MAPAAPLARLARLALMKQLALPFAEPHSYAPEDFCPAPSNALAREFLARSQAWSNGRLVLWGEPGCGKTHLLNIWAEANHAALLNGPELQMFAPKDTPVAVDDADAVAEPQALLHLLNAAAEAQQPVLLTARQPPARQAIKLADLSSRLRAAEAVEIRAPEDELLARLLTRLAAERQLGLSIGVHNFLLSQLPRTAGALREAVARLDHAALDRGTKMTRAAAAEILGDLIEA